MDSFKGFKDRNDVTNFYVTKPYWSAPTITSINFKELTDKTHVLNPRISIKSDTANEYNNITIITLDYPCPPLVSNSFRVITLFRRIIVR